jgi:hypothetical protein
MSKKKKKPKKHSEDRRPTPGRLETETMENPEVYQIVQYLNNELQKSQQLIDVVRKEHCQLRDGFIFLISKMNELQPDIEQELASYYATNHNLTGSIELNDYNIENAGDLHEGHHAKARCFGE